MRKLKPLAVLLGCLLVLSSCAALDPRAAAIRAAVLDRGAAFYDQTLVDAEETICRIASGGSIARRYWTNQKLFDAWMTICYPTPNAPASLPSLSTNPAAEPIIEPSTNTE